MKTITREPELQVHSRDLKEPLPVAEGTRLHHTYFAFSVEVPELFETELVEVPDDRLFQHVVLSGSLDWLAEPGEDVYSLEDGEAL